ncbi:MAG TPA: SagB/ThcOx family dehydrogenase [Candidatus Binataceae bacterium]|nr:SagB/ThcOx family dehydrogenase [Candidatus Binataceae bacterium]
MSNDQRDAARLYHEVTKHSYTNVRSNPHGLDWDNRPLSYKIYPAAGAIALPRELDLSAMPATAAIAGPAAAHAGDAETPLTLEAITRILFCAYGLTRSKSVGGEDYHFRAAASAGALYPIEIYLAASEVEGTEPGLYHFSPADLKLRGLRRGDWRDYLSAAAATRPALAEARAIVILSAIFWRSAWKYRARAYRYCFWDAGTVLANLSAAANADAVPLEIVTAFEDAPIERLIEVDADREGIICMVPLGRSHTGSESRASAGAQTAAPLPPLELDTVPLSAQEKAYDDLLTIQRASRLASAAEVSAVAAAALRPERAADESPAIAPPTLPATDSLGLGETILRRGSTRTFAREAIGAEELATIMATSRAPLLTDFPSMVEPYLIVNAIDDLAPGAYYYRRSTGDLVLLKAGDFRAEAGYLCLEQALGADCSALICYMTNLERALDALGNRGYRNAHLEAGIHGGRAYLAAYSLGRGASGLTFYDDDTTKFFAPHADDKSPLLMVAVGMPRSRAASLEDS